MKTGHLKKSDAEKRQSVNPSSFRCFINLRKEFYFCKMRSLFVIIKITLCKTHAHIYNICVCTKGECMVLAISCITFGLNNCLNSIWHWIEQFPDLLIGIFSLFFLAGIPNILDLEHLLLQFQSHYFSYIEIRTIYPQGTDF